MRNVILIFFFIVILSFSLKSINAINPETKYPDVVYLRDFKNSFVDLTDYNAFLFHSDFESLTFPLKRAGNLILLEAIIDSVPGNLILDTGSSSLVLNSIYFRQGRRAGAYDAGGITGSSGLLSRTQAGNIQISEISFINVEAHVTDLGHIEQARNIKVLGFFGLSLFSQFEVVVDLKNNILELHKTDYRGSRTNRPDKPVKFDLDIPARIESNVLFIDALINRRKLTFCLDTGAESNVLSSHLPNSVLTSVDILSRSSLRGAGSQNVEVLYGVLNDFSIGKTSIGGMNIIITNLRTMSQFYGVNIDGMLGCEFLEKGVFYINMKQKKIGIVFNE